MENTKKSSSRRSNADFASPTFISTASGTDTELASDYESTAEEDPAMPPQHTLLSEGPFSTETSKLLFESIDQLRRCGAGQDLDLPQLVIVGKQSAGKSSLLQSLTDIPFPVDGRLCTRFATRIVSRRTSPGTSDIVSASIEPGDINPFKYTEDYAAMSGFDHLVPSMTAEAFENLIVEAKNYMGIDSELGTGKKNFSSMVLKIELSGPKRSHFAILDLPGIFSAETENVTKQEMDGVRKMVTSYMQKQENIIICVADATDDLANQQIFSLAGDFVDSSRIVGVFTKCDRTQHPETVVEIVKGGKGIPNKSLTWYVVRNRSPRDLPSVDRETAEVETFSQEPWLEIPEKQRGTSMLKKYLASVLSRRIRESFPVMQDTVSKLLQAERLRRKEFGDARSEPSQRLTYLLNIVKEYQDIASKALRQPGELSKDSIKLRGLTHKENDRFTYEMMNNGHYFEFLDIGGEIETLGIPDEDSDDSESGTPAVVGIFSSRTTRQTPPRNRLPLTPSPSPPSKRQNIRQASVKKILNPLYAEIRSQIKVNRGEELPGMLNPAVLKPLWRKQTSKWRELGEHHLNKIISLTADVATKIFEDICDRAEIPTKTKMTLADAITEFSEQSKKLVMLQLDDLCKARANMALQTTDPKFLERVREARMLRFKAALERYKKSSPAGNYVLQTKDQANQALSFDPEVNQQCMIVNSNSIELLFNEMHPYGTRTQNTEDEIHDLLKAYYEISLQNFIYDVVQNIVEPFLNSATGPLFGLSTQYIMDLPEAEVDELGGEDESIVVGRRDTELRIERLEEACRIAAKALRGTREVVGL